MRFFEKSEIHAAGLAMDLEGRVTIAALANFTQQPCRGQIREGREALADIIHEGQDLAGPAHLPRAVDRRLQAALDVFADRFRVAAGLSRDRGHGEPLPVSRGDQGESSASIGLQEQLGIELRTAGHGLLHGCVPLNPPWWEYDLVLRPARSSGALRPPITPAEPLGSRCRAENRHDDQNSVSRRARG